MTTVIASAQWYAFKSGKKNYKMMERSTLLADANRTGNANKSIKQLNKMQGKQEKQNKKSFQFK
jgi:hypothetical protein